MVKEIVQSQLEGVDRGWSWVIASACCFGSLVLAGIFRTSGVLFVAFISNFDVTREEASWPMVVCIAVLNLTGPFSGMLGQRFGARPIIIIGAIIATIGISSCYFTTSLKVITILFGGVFGMGYGFMNTLMPVILNAYFLNLRATANGIATSGSCVGSIILPIVFEYLISSYGLSGCFLLTGGIVLHLTIVGALMRPPPWMLIAKVKTNKADDQNKFSKYVERSDCDNSVSNREVIQNKIYPNVAFEGSAKHKISEYECKEVKSGDVRNLINELDCADYMRPLTENTGLHTENSTNTTNTTSDKSLIDYKPPVTAPCVISHRILSSTIIKSFTAVLTCPMFYITAITNVCFYFLYHMYVVIIVDYALDRKVLDTDTKNVLFAFSISDLFGRLCFGWITDRKLIPRSCFVMLCMTMIGIVFCAFPHADGYIAIVVISCLYGLLLGCTLVVFPILLVDFCGLELHAVAYGCMCFMNGFASFGRPFLIGYFRDSIGSYSSMFYILGALSIATSGLWLLEKCFANKQNISSQQIV